MHTLPANIVKEIELLFSSFQKMYDEHKLLLFPDFKKGDITPLVSGAVPDSDKFLHLKEDITVNSDLTDKTQAEKNPFLKKLFRTFQLSFLLSVKCDHNYTYYLALVSGKQKVSEQVLKILKVYRTLIKFLIENETLKDKLIESTDYLKQMLNEMSVLHEISRSIESSQNLDKLLEFIVMESMQLMHAEAGSLMLVVPDTDEMEFRIAKGPKSDGVKPFRLKIGKGIAGWVAEHGRPILIPDAYADPRFDPSFDKRSGFKTQSYLCVPLTHHAKVIGVMTVLNRLDGLPFTENDKELLETFASQAALAIQNAKLLKEVLEKERLEKELQVAAEIQKGILPDKIPAIKGLDISATYLPAREMSGDFYDVFHLDEQKLAFVVADVAGKGVPASLLVANMQASLRAYLEFSDDILSIVGRVNEKIIASSTPDRFITFFIGLYDLRENTFTYINAGHNPPLYIQGGVQGRELSTGGIFLGMMPWQYQSEKVFVAKNSMLVLYTDGLVEAMNERDEEFGEERLKQLVAAHLNLSALEMRKIIVSNVQQHCGNIPLQDDLTLLIIKRNES